MKAIALENKKKEWASWGEQQYQRCKNARATHERQWYLNLAFFLGRHYVAPITVAGQGFRLTAPKAPPWRVRLTINKIRTAVRKECSKLTSSRPIPVVVPATSEDEDYSAAQVGEQILKAKFATADWGHKYRMAVWWTSVTGNGFLKSYYNPSAKDYDNMSLPPAPTLPTGEPVPMELLAEAGAKDPQVAQLHASLEQQMNTPVPAVGKICDDVVTPFHIFVPNLLADMLESQPYLIQVMTQSPQWVMDNFGFMPNADCRASTDLMDAATLITKGAEEHLDAVLVKEIWIKPGAHADFPKGGLLTILSNRVVQVADEWPLPFPEFPYYKLNGIPTGGFYTDSVVVDLIPINKEINKTRSQMIEIKNTVGKPKFFYQQGSLNPKKISSEPGQGIPYTAGYNPPTPIAGQDYPQSMVNEIEILNQEFDDIASQHEISRGGTPSQVTSGTAIAFLQEQDDSVLSYQVDSIEAAIEMMGKHYLKYVSQYWSEDRIVKVVGNNRSFEAVHWKQGALKGNTDVRVQTGSALPESKAAKIAQINEFMMNGWLDPATGLEILNMSDLDKAMDEFLIDKRQAQRENLKMAEIPESAIALFSQPAVGPNGEAPLDAQTNWDGTPFEQTTLPVPVNSWDNHEAHIQFHNLYRKTQEFEQLPPANKQLFEQHVQLHQMSLMSVMVNEKGQTIQDNSNAPDEEEFEGPEETETPQEETPPEGGETTE